MAIPRILSAPVGRIAQSAGRTYDYLTPGAGTSTLTNAGRSITDLNQAYTGGGIDGNPSFTKVLGASTTTKPAYDPAPVTNESKANTGQNTDYSYGSGSGSGGGGSSSTYDPQAILQYDNGIRTANEALGRIDGQLGTAERNIDGSYLTNFNKLTGQRQIAQRDYTTNKTNQLQDYQGARTDIANNSRNLLTNARRLLGSQGAGGGSADRFQAPDAAQREESNGNAVVQKTNSRNLAALDTAYNDSEKQFDGSLADLARQKEASLRDTRSKFEQNRADVLSQIAQLTGQKALAQGQNYQQAMAATQPYSQRISSILNTIDGLAANPAVMKAQDVTLARPDMAQYQWNRFAAPSAPQQDPSLYTPNARILFGLDQQDKNQQQLA